MQQNKDKARKPTEGVREQDERMEKLECIMSAPDYPAREEEVIIAESILDGTCEAFIKHDADPKSMSNSDWSDFLRAKGIEMRLRRTLDIEDFFECFRKVVSDDRKLRNEAYVFAITCIKYQPSLGCAFIAGHDPELLSFFLDECRIPGRLTGWVYDMLHLLVQCDQHACDQLVQSGLYEALVENIKGDVANGHLMMVFQSLTLIVRTTSIDTTCRSILDLTVEVLMRGCFSGTGFIGSFTRALECLHFLFLRLSLKDNPFTDVWSQIRQIATNLCDLRSLTAVLKLMQDLLCRSSRDLCALGDLAWAFNLLQSRSCDERTLPGEYRLAERLFFDTAACSCDMFPESISHVADLEVMLNRASMLIVESSFDVKPSAMAFFTTVVSAGYFEQCQTLISQFSMIEVVAGFYDSIPNEYMKRQVLTFLREALEMCVKWRLVEHDSLVGQFGAVEWDVILSADPSEEVEDLLNEIKRLLEALSMDCEK